MHEYIRKLLYKDLSKTTTEKVSGLLMTQFRQFTVKWHVIIVILCILIFHFRCYGRSESFPGMILRYVARSICDHTRKNLR